MEEEGKRDTKQLPFGGKFWGHIRDCGRELLGSSALLCATFPPSHHPVNGSAKCAFPVSVLWFWLCLGVRW